APISGLQYTKSPARRAAERGVRERAEAHFLENNSAKPTMNAGLALSFRPSPDAFMRTRDLHSTALTRALAVLAAALMVATATPAAAQRRGAGGERSGVYKAQITPHWFDGGSKFWYQNDLAGGKREFVLVDAEQGRRDRAFDHEKLAAALKSAGIAGATADRLPLDAVEFKSADRAIDFRADGKDWRFDLASY